MTRFSESMAGMDDNFFDPPHPPTLHQINDQVAHTVGGVCGALIGLQLGFQCVAYICVNETKKSDEIRWSDVAENIAKSGALMCGLTLFGAFVGSAVAKAIANKN